MSKFSRLVNTSEALLAFRARYHIPNDLINEYYFQDVIANQRILRTIFVPLIVIIEGGVRFPLSSLLI